MGEKKQRFSNIQPNDRHSIGRTAAPPTGNRHRPPAVTTPHHHTVEPAESRSLTDHNTLLSQNRDWSHTATTQPAGPVATSNTAAAAAQQQHHRSTYKDILWLTGC